MSILHKPKLDEAYTTKPDHTDGMRSTLPSELDGKTPSLFLMPRSNVRLNSCKSWSLSSTNHLIVILRHHRVPEDLLLLHFEFQVPHAVKITTGTVNLPDKSVWLYGAPRCSRSNIYWPFYILWCLSVTRSVSRHIDTMQIWHMAKITKFFYMIKLIWRSCFSIN